MHNKPINSSWAFVWLYAYIIVMDETLRDSDLEVVDLESDHSTFWTMIWAEGTLEILQGSICQAISSMQTWTSSKETEREIIIIIIIRKRDKFKYSDELSLFL